MKEISDVLAGIANVPPDHMTGVITLVALGVATFALYVVLAVVKERSK